MTLDFTSRTSLFNEFAMELIFEDIPGNPLLVEFALAEL